MKKVCNLVGLLQLSLLSFIIASNVKLAHANANENIQQQQKVIVEESEDLLTSRKVITAGVNLQRYAGDYRNLTKNSFLDSADNNVDIKETKGVQLGVAYEYQVNAMRLLNPYIGLAFDINIPFSKQDSSSSFKSYLGNFADAKLRIGNNFKIIKKFLDINIYATAGLGSSVYFAQAIGNGEASDLAISILNIKYDPKNGTKPTFGFAYGYVYGGGVDLIIAKHLLVGAFYEHREMRRGSNKGFVKNYENNTAGVKVGFVF